MTRRNAAAVALLLVFLPSPLLAWRKPHQYLVFTNVAVVDVRDGTYESGMTVVIRDDRIQGIARHGLIELGHNVQVVNAGGRYLVAGRWDMQAGALTGLRTAQVGQSADLLVLDAWPLADVHDTGRVWAAVVKGKFLDRRALEKMAAEAAGGTKKP